MRPAALFVAVLAAAVASAARAGELVLYAGGAAPVILYAGDAGRPIEKAAGLLAHDLEAITGQRPFVSPSPGRFAGPGIVVGPVGSHVIDQILAANGIDSTAIKGKWETYGRAVVPAPWDPHERALVIFGSDVRGAIWGVVDLTRAWGVSPWEWWADVTPRRVARVAVSDRRYFSKEPAVKYRGIFLNAGTHGLEPWAGKTFDPAYGHLGPKTYARIYELMWRLKANTLWPFMGQFNDNARNYETAADYAIVRGSSHVEMLLRTNGPEWSDRRGPYNWFTNRQGMIDYWTEAVRRWGKYDNLYTVGLRDQNDFPMQGARTPEEIADGLSSVIAAQRRILSGVIGKPAAEIPQVLTLYKEVLPAYMTGRLKLPDDVTLIWPDDDFDYIRQLGDAAQRRRSGGSGVYFHSIFWGPPMPYLWIGAMDPWLMWEEMTKAARFDARRIWILNVGSIKPVELLTQFFLDLAFDADAYPTSASVENYLRGWAAGNFGPEQAEAIARILTQYYTLAFDRNPEFMSWSEVFPETPVRQTQYNLLDFGDENARRADAYRRLMAAARRIMAALPADRRDAFYELVQYPVEVAGSLNLRQLDLDKSIAYGLQHRASANRYAQDALRAYDDAVAATDFYNHQVAGGKWNPWMLTSYQGLPAYERPHVPTWNADSNPHFGVQAEGGEYIDQKSWWMANLPPFHPELRRSRYIDIFVTGPIAATWTARATVPWIKLDRTAGQFSPATGVLEDRIQVSIDWAHAPLGQPIPHIGVLPHPIGTTGDVAIHCSAAPNDYVVHVLIAPPNPYPNVSFIESGGIVSLYAQHADARAGRWETLPGLAHSGVGADIRTPIDMPSIDPNDSAAVLRAPSLTYRFATESPDDDATLTIYALPTFPITSHNGLRLAVSIDHAPPQLLDFAAREYSESWRQHVLTNEAAESLNNLHLAPGPHTVTLYALDPGLTLDRLEVAFMGAPQAYAAVPETRPKSFRLP